MPYGIYPIPKPGSPYTVAQRLRTWWQRDHLDEELAAGRDPDSAELRLRSAQLVSQEWRLELAKALQDAVRDSHRGGVPFTTRLTPRPAAVRGCADDLVAVARRLSDGKPIDVRGAAITSRLVMDGTGPLYVGTETSLRRAARLARLALDPLAAETGVLSEAA